MRKLCFLFLMFYFTNSAVFSKTIVTPIFLDKYGVLTTELNIMGNPQTFNLDLGSREGLHLPARMIKSIPSLKMSKDKVKTIDLAGNISYLDKFTIENLNVNGMLFKNVTGVERKYWGLTAFGDPEDAPDDADFPVIGLNFFSNHVITIDFIKNELTIDEKNSTTSKNSESEWISLPFYISNEGLTIPLVNGEKKFNMILDTGSPFSVFKAIRLPKDVKTFSCDIVHLGLNLHNCKAIKLFLMKNNKNIATFYAASIEDIPPEFEADGLLGNDFFKKFVVKIDLYSKVLFVKKS